MAVWRSRADLLNARQDERADLRYMMRMFMSPGFVDFNYSNVKLGIDLRHNRDFAVVSLGRNFYAEPGERYFSVLAAGVHHPGTAHAVKHLGDPSHFVDHPFGGILEVQVPDDNEPNPDEVPWHDKIDKSRAYWHTAGKGLEYTPQKLLDRLKEMEGGIPTDVYIGQDEIKQHIELVELLRRDTAM